MKKFFKKIYYGTARLFTGNVFGKLASMFAFCGALLLGIGQIAVGATLVGAFIACTACSGVVIARQNNMVKKYDQKHANVTVEDYKPTKTKQAQRHYELQEYKHPSCKNNTLDK